MKLFSDYPFSKIEGYDLREELCMIANNNFKLLEIDKRCRAFQANALEFKAYDEFNWFYMFNPFPNEIMMETLKNIDLSLKNNPRKIKIIYMNPTCDNLFEKMGYKKIYRQGKIDWIKIYVYTK